MNMIAALLDWLFSSNRRMDKEWRHGPHPNIRCRRYGLDYF
jgi:hypothetical protein